MRTRLTLKPGDPGTKKLLAQYGEKLVCVRYRYDARTRRRHKTVELIVDTREWPPHDPEDLVAVRIAWEEHELRERVHSTGGVWIPGQKVWQLSYGKVGELGLKDRIVDEVTKWV